MSDVAFSQPAPSRRTLRAMLEWLLTVFSVAFVVLVLIVCGASLEYAIGYALGRYDGAHPTRTSPRRRADGDNERARRLGRKLRLMLGLDARAARRAAARQAAIERAAVVRDKLERRRQDQALRRAEIGRRLRWRLRRALLTVLAGVGALAIVAVALAALVVHFTH